MTPRVAQLMKMASTLSYNEQSELLTALQKLVMRTLDYDWVTICKAFEELHAVGIVTLSKLEKYFGISKAVDKAQFERFS